jgi:hypothetical protein
MIQDASTSHCKMVYEVTKKLYSDKIWSDTNVPLVVKAFFLCFYGTININAPNVSAINILQTLCKLQKVLSPHSFEFAPYFSLHLLKL